MFQICIGSQSCGPMQWVGGFYRYPNGAMNMICCSYDPLLSSTNLGVAAVGPAEIYSGGETDTSFDYIRNIVPRLNPDGSIHYDVEVGRMPCAEPIPLSSYKVQEVYNPPPYVIKSIFRN